LGDEFSTPRRVFHVNRQRITRADVVFTYINELDCHGTLIELGMAAELYKEIVVCFGPQLTLEQTRELWMVRMCAARVYEQTEAWWAFVQQTGCAIPF
jgi:nucleoside 2-deoxyribosyltransferase